MKGTAGLSRLLVNVPPNHAKSMTITINYVTYRIAKDPNINVLIVSKTQEQAKKFLYAIKQRLTHPRYGTCSSLSGQRMAIRPPLTSGRRTRFTWAGMHAIPGRKTLRSKH